ncbi:succinate-semialdehyde dehydrogenase/glutarate-semialdehyde dehydrogenase [Salegentibacter sp. 24]|jgi:succinate-semialdehyde dehydrogenase/glutarate-semialdehyde dehydrogenase|uniref:NAD-dependent succinate-semialdehyde dehydrogenase n=1 Tax=Salegentibacter sp. 24 TaxID=2183986 RepID=UPI00105F1F22|nr:NAD-dependent succinate-semialdehyde dehydrogenase [Salegentibacter sp. 24]TDN81552.1 succinate-semialdehyde dehydrogenase/glutarate-semialdehyde dehydrogenase [Salegentibacter sp. 24]
MEFYSTNPYNGVQVGKYTAQTTEETSKVLNLSGNAFKDWSKKPLSSRTALLKNAAQVLRDHVNDYAQMITQEMGKPISESRAEINKCAWVCDYYAENAAGFLAPEEIKTDATHSYVRHDPIGSVFAIMPWNFPFWQVFRFAAPTLTAGNTGILKHAPNVFGCALKIEEVFKKAGYPKGVFQNLIVHHDQTEMIIAHDAVQAVTLTGSEAAGSAVAQLSGKYIKKSLLELGGNNSFIVWEDADIDRAVKTAVSARMLNCGQSCIAAKRFILLEGIYEEFISKFKATVNDLKVGDIMDHTTQIGPLARKDLADQLQSQVKRSLEQGAELILGGEQDNCFHQPTILGNVRPGMPAFDEETFGPLAAVIKAKSIEEAFELSEKSKFGLGTTVFTKDIKKAMEMAEKVSDGAYFVNELVKSDPRLPFGGTKRSGYGRELAKEGMMEFVNKKTVYVKA